MLGKRRESHEINRPHHITNVFIGTALLWFGWFGFNSASALEATPRAAMSALVTAISASSGAISWVLIDMRRSKKFSGVGFCCGALAGLVGITPSSGYVAPWAAIVIGIITSSACNSAFKIKELIDIDDTLDAFGLHGVGGFVGSILTGIFAQKSIASLDNSEIMGGAIEGNPIQILYQFCGSTVIAAYAFIGTVFILAIISRIPGMHLALTEEEEILGCDHVEMGESAYNLFAHEQHELIENTKRSIRGSLEKQESVAETTRCVVENC